MEKRADQITSKKSTTSAAGTSGGGSSSSCGDDDDYFPAAKKSRPSHRIGCDEKPRELKRAAADKVSTSPRRSRNGGGGAAASGSRHASPSTKAGSAMNATTNTTGTTAATVATVVPTAATVAASTTAMLTTTVVPSSTSPSKDGKRVRFHFYYFAERTKKLYDQKKSTRVALIAHQSATVKFCALCPRRWPSTVPTEKKGGTRMARVDMCAVSIDTI